jgi:hypothetical protein
VEDRAMAVEFIAWIAPEDYEEFRTMLSPIMPDSYEMWLRVRDRGKRRAFEEHATIFEEIEVYPEEFQAFCQRRARAEFSIYGLDLFAREKVYADRRPKTAYG